MNTLIGKIDDLIDEQSLLKHKFYVMWNRGELSLESLSGYSKEYFHLVKSIPSYIGAVMGNGNAKQQEAMKSIQQEEYEHIDLWIKFGNALGVSPTEMESNIGLDKTRQATSDLAALMTSFEKGAAVMYAIEQEIPKISLSKIEGLRKFYDISGNDAIEYFRIHAEADIRHAAFWRKVLEHSSVPEEDLIAVAGKSLEAQNLLLDSCYEAYC